MKLLKTMMSVTFLFSIMLCQAQTTQNSAAGAKPAFTDDDLKKYAITMDSIKGMQETLQQIIAETVQKNTVMSVQRYNQLFKLTGDQAKLTEAGATPEEIAFLKEVSELRTTNTARINSTYQALAKDYVGLKTFNAIKKSLDADPNLKTRYEAISKEVSSTGSSGSN